MTALKPSQSIMATSIATGETVTFSSINSAERDGGFCRTSVWRCIHGMQKTHAGMIFSKQQAN